jgi:hypothetical protein
LWTDRQTGRKPIVPSGYTGRGLIKEKHCDKMIVPKDDETWCRKCHLLFMNVQSAVTTRYICYLIEGEKTTGVGDSINTM